MKEVALKHDHFKIHLNPGECNSCPLSSVCPCYKADQNHCVYVDQCANEFMGVARNSEFIRPEDMFNLRMLASQYAALMMVELQFKKKGIIVSRVLKTGEEHFGYNPLFVEYNSMISKFQAGCAKFGLNPLGRRSLKEAGDKAAPDALMKYIEAKFKVIQDDKELTPAGKHSRFLQRPAAPEPSAPTNTGSASPESLRALYDEGSD